MPRNVPFDAFSRVNLDCSPLREQDNRIPNLVDCQCSADVVMRDRVFRHRSVLSFRGLLYQAQAARRGDVQQALHAIVTAAGEDDGNHTRAIRMRRRNEERIDRGAVKCSLASPSGQTRSRSKVM